MNSPFEFSLCNKTILSCPLSGSTEKEKEVNQSEVSQGMEDTTSESSKHRETNNNKETSLPVRETVIQKTVETPAPRNTIEGCLGSAPQAGLTSESRAGRASLPRTQAEKQSERRGDDAVIDLDTSTESMEEGGAEGEQSMGARENRHVPDREVEGQQNEKTRGREAGSRDTTQPQRVVGSLQIDQQEGTLKCRNYFSRSLD